METFVPTNEVANCRLGRMLYNRHDAYIGRSLALYGEFSKGEADLFRKIVRPGEAVIDVGANIGAHTVLFAQLAGPEGFVIAFEPQRIAYQMLCANLALNSITNAWCFQEAVGAEPGSILVPFVDPTKDNNFGGLPLGMHESGQSVRIVTLDSLNIGRCRLIKIDVEGMEAEAIKGATETIARHRPLLYVENDRDDNTKSNLIGLIQSLGYSTYWHCPMLFDPNNFLGNPENVFSNLASHNMICVPTEKHDEVVIVQE